MKQLSILFLLFSSFAVAQSDLLDELDAEFDMGPLYAESAFKGLKIINLESTKMVDKGEMYFIVAHRFGSIQNGFDDFFGLDVASNKLQLIYGVNDNINFGVARSSYQKTYALNSKLRLLRQQTEKSPVTIGAYCQLTINNQLDLDRNPELDFNHRLTYTAQALISRKFNEKLSLQLTPTLIHKNLTERIAEDNLQFVMAAGGRYKLTKRLSLNMEYGLMTSRPKELNTNAGSIKNTGFEALVRANPISTNDFNWNVYNNLLSIGLDIETGGHVFQLHFTNSRTMLEHSFLTEASGDWSKGDIHFGFNISRVFDW